MTHGNGRRLSREEIEARFAGFAAKHAQDVVRARERQAAKEEARRQTKLDRERRQAAERERQAAMRGASGEVGTGLGDVLTDASRRGLRVRDARTGRFLRVRQ
jgi:hypothetical protein